MANIFIYSPNVIGKSMAGPAIRSWEIAKALSKDHQVTLVSPNQPDIEGYGFQLMQQGSPKFKQHQQSADVMIVQVLTLDLVVSAKRHGTRIIMDAYDPVPLEILELFKEASSKEKKERYNQSVAHLLFNFKMADGIICASEKQRDLWIGLMLGLDLIKPSMYDQDSSLRQFIDVVPFGLSDQVPIRTGPGIREKYGLSASDKILLWGGGIWNWFDPLSLIKAVKIISQTRQDIKLVFMGIKHPDPSVPEMVMCTKAIQLAEELELIDRFVFFNYGWIPYDERQNFLMDASVGVSMHFDHLETRFSFRTRMLDYIWAQLPIVATNGDSFADLIQQKHLGLVVPSEDEKAIAEAVINLIDDPVRMQSIKLNLLNMQSQFTWNRVAIPINKMIQSLLKQPKKKWNWQDVCNFSNFFWIIYKKLGFTTAVRKVIQKSFKIVTQGQ